MKRRLQLVLALLLCAGLTVFTCSPAQAQVSQKIEEARAQHQPNSNAARAPASAMHLSPSQGAERSFAVPGATAYGHDAFNSTYASFPFDDPTNVTEITSATFGPLPGAGVISDNPDEGYFITGTKLFSLDVPTGDSTVIGDLGTPLTFSGMAYNESTDTYYGVTSEFGVTPPGVGSLYEIDVSAGTATEIGQLVGTSLLVGIAFDGSGTLYGVDRDDDSLYEIDTSTGAATVIGPLGFDNNFDEGLAYDEGSGQLYFAAINAGAGNSPEVHTIDTATGASTLVATFPNLRQFGWLGGQYDPPMGPSLALSPPAVDFGLVAPGTDATQTVTLNSNGTADVEVTDISIGGMDTGQFSIASAPATPFTIAAGESETVDVTFAPSTTGNFEATLDVTSNDDGTPGTVTSATLSGVGGSVSFGGPGAGGYFFANNTEEAEIASGFSTPGVVDVSIPSGNETDVTTAFQSDDEAFVGPVAIGFDFQYFGQTYDSFCLYANGLLHLLNTGDTCPTNGTLNFFSNDPIPTADVPNNIIAFYWDDLAAGDGPSSVEALYGNDADGNLVVSFEDYGFFFGSPTEFFSMDLVLYDDSGAENDRIRMQYYEFGADTATDEATIGIENADGSEGIQYRFDDNELNGPLLTADGDSLALMFGPDPATLPVELADFTSTVDDGSVNLSWRTLSEENNRGFQVQMKRHRTAADGSSQPDAWQQVGFVESTAPGGTSTEAQTYALRVADLDAGDYTFRLKQVDLDGLPTVFSEQTVEASIGLNSTYQLSGASPNPFNQQATFNIAVQQAQHVTVEVYDVLGRRVMEVFDGNLSAEDVQTITVSGEGLSSGVYFYRVTGEDFTASKKMMLVR